MTIPTDFAAYLVQLAAIALVGFLLKRSINNLDDSIRDVKAGLKALDTTDRDQAKYILEIQIQAKYLSEKVHSLEDALARLAEKFEEFGKFLARMGFARAGNKVPGKPETPK